MKIKLTHIDIQGAGLVRHRMERIAEHPDDTPLPPNAEQVPDETECHDWECVGVEPEPDGGA